MRYQIPNEAVIIQNVQHVRASVGTDTAEVVRVRAKIRNTNVDGLGMRLCAAKKFKYFRNICVVTLIHDEIKLIQLQRDMNV